MGATLTHIKLGLPGATVLLALLSQGALGSQVPAAQHATVHPASWPAARWPIPSNAAIERRISGILARMSVEEKVGQIIQADIASVTPDDVRDYHLGSILNGGNSAPGGNEFAPPAEWLALADRFYAASTDTRGGGSGIPVIWGTDAVHGHSNIVGATLFPHNIGLGAAHDPALIERIGAATALEVRATGIEWTFAPTLTVPQDYRWGRAYEGYSSDPALVTAYAGRMIRGLQGAPLGKPMLQGPHVLASTKHFIADGGTDEGRDQGDAKIDEQTLRRVHGAPYVAAIAQGVGTIMTSFSSWQGVKIAGNKGLVTDVLKGRMNYGGFVITDWNAHGQVAGCTNTSCPQAINAGVDMYMAPDTWKGLYASLATQVRSGIVPMARLDDAVSRILRTKLRIGLFEAGKPSSRPYSGQFDLIGSQAHRAIAREAVRKSLVLLKSQSSVLPIRPGANILVAGDGADDIARQAGGWTITWQGTGVTNRDFPGATSIWRGIESAVAKGGGRATLSPDGHYDTKPDIAVVVFGETPYAEFQGDLATLQLRPELRRPYETMKRLKAAGIPVVALMLTGRPLFVNPELNIADAFVVAWLPGSEGAGIADLLVQDPVKPAFDFSGTLPAAWPATARPYGSTLFSRGFGLTLKTPRKSWRVLSEVPGVADVGPGDVFMERGQPVAAWSLNIGDPAGGDRTRITTIPATVLNGRATVSATDHLVQEGARNFAFSGGGAEVLELATHEPIDISRQTNGDVLLLVTMRRESGSIPKATLTMTSSSGISPDVSFGPTIASLKSGQWATLGVPLKCFAKSGMDMTKIITPFRLSAYGPLNISLSRVALGTFADAVVKCSD